MKEQKWAEDMDRLLPLRDKSLKLTQIEDSTVDNRPVRKLTDYLGVLRTVVFCSEDVLLVKGPGRARRV